MTAHSLSGRSIFLTGGTGFVGKTLLDHMVELQGQPGHLFDVTVLSRDPASFLRSHPQYEGLPWLNFVRGSLKALPSPERRFSDVIHAAADTHLLGQGVLWIDQIVNGTHAVLDFAVKVGAQRFLHTSSGAVYGPQPAGLSELPEYYAGAPLTTHPSSTYGQAKRMAEQLCTVYFHEYGLQTVNARCFAFAGKHLPLSGPYALGNFIQDALTSKVIRVRGDGTAIRSYLDGQDMAHWLMTLLMCGTPGEAYNVGSNEGITMLGLAETVAQLLAPGKPVVVENSQPVNLHRSRYVPSIEKTGEIGLRPRYGLAQAITRTVSGITFPAHI